MEAPVGPVTTFAKRVNINMGADNDTVILGIFGQAGNSVNFQAAVRINGGPGSDLADFLAHGNTFVVPPVFPSVETVV